MPRPITLFTGQWADLPFDQMCQLASEWGYDGLEIACWGDHFEVDRALADDAYVDAKRETLARYDLQVHAISSHLVGQAVCDHPIDERHRGILPARIWGDGNPRGYASGQPRRSRTPCGRRRSSASTRSSDSTVGTDRPAGRRSAADHPWVAAGRAASSPSVRS